MAAREEVEKLKAASPNDYYAYINLGLIDAFLGRNEEAVREGRRAVELVAAVSPVGRNDASAGLALIYARTGETDLALNLIEHLLTLPADLTGGSSLQHDGRRVEVALEWDPLRKNPRFQKIIAGPEPKTVY